MACTCKENECVGVGIYYCRQQREARLDRAYGQPLAAHLDRRIAELEDEARALRQTVLTISESGNELAQAVVESYAREGRDLFAERRGAKI